MNKYTRLFIEESRVYLPSIAAVLDRLREGTHGDEDLKEGQRLAHSIKGMALYEEQGAISSLSAAVELGFERLRECAGSEGLAGCLERSLPLLAALVDEVETAGTTSSDPDGHIREIEAALAPDTA